MSNLRKWHRLGCPAALLVSLCFVGCTQPRLMATQGATRHTPTLLTLGDIQDTPGGTRIALTGSQPFSYSLGNHNRPLKLTVDVQQAHVTAAVDRIVNRGGVKTVQLSPVPDTPDMARLEIQLEDTATYSITKEQESLFVHVHSAGSTPASPRLQGAVPPPHPVQQNLPIPSVAATDQSRQYRVGSGDVLAIATYDEPDLTLKVRVAETGRITFPLIGSIEAEGLTTTEIVQRLEDALSPRFLLDPQVFVEVAEYGSKKVFIVGAVEQPAALTLRGRTTLLDALSQVGGLSHSSTLMLFRRSPVAQAGAASDDNLQAQRIDLDRLLRQGDMTLNMVLQPDDVLYIPKPDAVFVFGEVQRIGPVPVPDGGMSLVEAINMAGGFGEYAAPHRTRVLRSRDGQEHVIQVDMAAIIKGELSKDIKLQANDIVIVPQSAF
jgi:polysaccharide export outer membrane protein